MEQRDVSDILKELDNEVAALSEMRANERKTAQEKIASQTQQQPGRVTAFGARLDDDIAGEVSQPPPVRRSMLSSSRPASS